MNATLTVDDGGKIALPDDVRDRYQLGPNTFVRIIETRGGILLVPLTNEPMSDELAREVEEWQALSAASFDSFPCRTTNVVSFGATSKDDFDVHHD